MEGQRAAKGLSGGGPCFKRNASPSFETFMPEEHVFSGAVPFVATLASTPFVSVIALVFSRSQEASLAPRPTSCSLLLTDTNAFPLP